jgi:RNA polymerase sigma-70 factor, ECF subfamily
MPAPESHQATELLVAWRKGDRDALERLVPLVEAELRRLASGYMRQERTEHTLQPTALINEAYIRLLSWKDADKIDWQSRAHFIGVAAGIMRRILVDYSRRQKKLKRGGKIVRVYIDSDQIVSDERTPDLDMLEEALIRLSAIEPRKAKVVELRVFGGLSVDEVAELTDSSSRTVKRDWTFALSWLHCQLTGTEAHDA